MKTILMLVAVATLAMLAVGCAHEHAYSSYGSTTSATVTSK